MKKQDVFNTVLDSLEEYMLSEVSDWSLNDDELLDGNEDVRKEIEKLRKQYQEAQDNGE